MLTAELALALGRAAARERRGAPAGPDRPRHPRVRADARGGARRRGRRGGRRCLLGGRAADPGRVDPRPPARPRPRRGRLRVPQPLARQRDQVLRRRRAQAGRRRRGRRSRPGSAQGAAEAARRPRGAGPRRSTGRSTTTCGRSLSAFQLDLSGRRVVLDCANGATYRAAPAVFERLGADGRDDRRRSPTGATSTRAAARPTRSCWPSASADAAPRSASPSTATATAWSPSTRQGSGSRRRRADRALRPASRATPARSRAASR